MIYKDNIKELLFVFSLILASLVNINKIGGSLYGTTFSTLVLLFVGGIYLKSYLSEKSPKKILEQNFTLKLLDKDGSKAKFEKIEKFKVIGRNITRLIETGHRSDGNIEDVNTSIGVCTNELSVKNYGYIINLDHPLEKGQYTRTFSYTMINSFKDDQEYWVLRNKSSVKNAKARLEFPSDRPPKEIAVRIMSDTEGIDITGNLKCLQDSPNHIYEIDLKIKSGSKMLIFWTW